MTIPVGELEVTVGSDTRDAELGMDKISSGFRALQKQAKESKGSLAGVATSLTAVAGQAGGAAGSVARFASTLTTSLAMGGALGLTIGAAVGGFQALSGAIREAAQDARQLRALDDMLGVSREEVDVLRDRFRALGQDVSQRVAVEIMQVGREAGYSASEIQRMAGSIQQVADLQGGDAKEAAKQYFAGLAGGADEAIEKFKQLAQQREDALSGRSQEERARMEVAAELAKDRVRSEEQLVKAQQRVADKQREIWDLEKSIADHRRKYGDVGLRGDHVNKVKALTQELEGLKVESQAAAEATEQLAKREKDLADAAQQAADSQRQLARLTKFQAEMRKAALQQQRADEEAARLEKENAANSAELSHRLRIMQAQAAADRKREAQEVADWEIAQEQRRVAEGRLSGDVFAAWEKERRRALALELQEIDRQVADASADIHRRARIMQAQMASDRRAELRELAEDEIRLQQEAAEKGRISQEAAAAWEKARREKLRADLAAVDAEEAAAERGRFYAIQAMYAKGREDRLAEARIAAAKEIAEEESKVDGIRYTWEEFYAWRSAREAQLQAELRQIAEREAEKAKREQEKLQAETDKLMRDRERNTVAGIQAGGHFLQGMRQALESGEAKDAFRALFQLASAVMSMVPGGQIPGAVMGTMAGLFHDGGMVGTDGAPIPRYHSGGMIVAHKGMMLPEPGPGEVPVLAQTGEGILSRRGVAAAGGPEAVRAWNAGEQPAAGGNVSLTINAPGGFLHQQLIEQAVAIALRKGAILQDNVFMRTIPDTRRVGRR